MTQLQPMTAATRPALLQATVYEAPTDKDLQGLWQSALESQDLLHPCWRWEWLRVLERALAHRPYCIAAHENGSLRGLLPLALVRSWLFGKFLVGLPYLNSGGVHAKDPEVANVLIDRAVELADQLDVRYLELRHEKRWDHPALNHELSSKVHMRLDLPDKPAELWDSLKSKVRSQVRKATKNGLRIAWGREELVTEFYSIFARNMRDLGTPVYSRQLFANILQSFGNDAEICVAFRGADAVAAGLLVHGRGVSEVPSASSLRSINHLNGNILLYWNLLSRAIERGQRVFDFGRSNLESSTYRFKRQWGASPQPAVWQYYIRRGDIEAMRPDSPSNQRKIALWRRLPIWFTRLVGPQIVRGIP